MPATRPEAMKLMRFWLNEGWKFRKIRNKNIVNDPQWYMDRVEAELKLLEEKSFVDYFLVVSDLVRFAKDSKIAVGPARGSSAASVVAYLLRITEVDPYEFPHMMFSRFVDPTRKDLPDIDIDLDDERRHEVWEYAERKYGRDNVGTIGNFIRYKGKNSLDDVARAHNLPKWAADVVKELVIFRSTGDSRTDDSLEDTFEMFPAAKAVLDQFPEFAQAIRLEGNVRNLGIHAAGMVLKDPRDGATLQDICAVYERQGRKVIAYDKKDAEYLGLLKIDLLGLSTMGMIALALEEIGMDIEDLYALPLNDPNVLKVFQEVDLPGIFQFEGRTTRFVCREVEPEHFNHLADINALSRPGPLFSETKTRYVETRHGRAQSSEVKAERLHPLIDEITDWTYYQIVYQEQVLAIIRDVGGFPMEDVHAIRRIISQKLGEAQFNQLFTKFAEGAYRLHGIESDLALRIWRFLATSATYSFVYAHAVGYTIIAYWCAWLKCYHPTAFYAAQLCKTGDERKRQLLATDAIRHDVAIKPPSLLGSQGNWSVDRHEADTVRAGFLQIPGIGPETTKRILEWRNSLNGRTVDWVDLQEVKGIGPKTVEKIRDFCQQDDPFGLTRTARIMRALRENLKPGNPFGIPTPTHNSDTIPRDGVHYDIVWCGIPRKKKYGDYIEDERARKGLEVEEIRANMKDPHLSRRCYVECFDDFSEDVRLRFNRWKFPEFRDRLDNLRCDGTEVVVAVGMKRDDFGVSLHVQEFYVLDLEDD